MSDDVDVCVVCRKPLLDGQDQVPFKAGQMQLGVVHASPCAEIVRSTVRAGGMMAFLGIRGALRRKFPKASRFIETFARYQREARDGSAQS